MTGVAVRPLEAALETAAFGEILEFLGDVLWRYLALGRPLYLERGIVFLDTLVIKHPFQAMARL